MTNTTTPVAADGTAPGPAPTGTGSTGTRVLGAVALVLVALTALYGLVISPPDRQLGETIRIIYMHVPTVSVAYIAFIITAVSSAMYLWKRTEFWDLLGASAAELGVLFFALTILEGALWGKTTWGTFWEWEPRLTTSAVLLLVYIGYLAVRAIPADARTRATRSAIIGLVAVVNIPIVHKAVDWWRGLHQGRTVLSTIDPEMGGSQLVAMYLALLAGLVVFVWLLIHRFRVAFLAERAADSGLEHAIEERRVEGATS
ncbi:MAG: cytochrome c biogenesis protein CcsA [Actinomycetota bacterium]|nr:cytochrome c biogenesis protein CcsA [Actinomycetota bacterium]